MAQLEPPPRNVEKWGHIWKEWLHRLYSFVFGHTGGSTPTSPATGTSWNAHGNTATGNIDGSDRLKIENASLWIDNGSGVGSSALGTGDYPSGAEWQNVAGSTNEYKFLWYGKKAAMRAGTVASNKWDESNIGSGSLAIGHNSLASNINAVAIGSNTDVSGAYSCAVGLGNSVTTPFSLAYSHNSIVDGATSGVMGNYCQASGSNSWVVGSGTVSNKLQNSNNNSLMIGVNSQYATLYLIDGKCSVMDAGASEVQPLSTLDINGSVGFAYTDVLASDGGEYNITGNEYTILVDIKNMTGSANTFTINLPALSASTINRRIYNIKVVDSSPGPPSFQLIKINPDDADAIEGWEGGGESTFGQSGVLLPDGEALNISYGTSVTIIAHNTHGGWWVL